MPNFLMQMRLIATFTALKRVMETEGMELEIIINPKTTDDGQSIIQVRTSIMRGLTWSQI